MNKTKTTYTIILGIVICLASSVYAQSVNITPLSTQISEKGTQTKFIRELYFGSRGSDVIALQKLLSSIKGIYPEGFVTGYYGPLTTKAVERLQNKYNLTVTGRVSGETFSKINDLNIDIYSGPIVISDLKTIPVSKNSSMISWKTNQFTTTEMYYSKSSFPSSENKWKVNDTNLSKSHTFGINNLSPATKYYFIIIATNMDRTATSTSMGEFVTQKQQPN